MKIRLFSLLLFLAGIAVVLLFRSHPLASETVTTHTKEPAPAYQGPTGNHVLTTYSKEPTLPYQGPTGNHFLTEHGLPESSPVQDLKLIGRVVDGVARIFKQLDTRHVATNEQLSAFLTGANPEGLEYLDSSLPIFQNGLLTDRWGNPYIVHPLGTGLLEIRSSGPDGTPYTSDDLSLHPNEGVLTR